MRYELVQIRDNDGSEIMRSAGRLKVLSLDYDQGLAEWRELRDHVTAVAQLWTGYALKTTILRITGWFGDWSQEFRYDERGRLTYDSGRQYNAFGGSVRSHRAERIEERKRQAS